MPNGLVLLRLVTYLLGSLRGDDLFRCRTHLYQAIAC